MKDPAFLFYYQDWLVGTYFLNRREKGAYMDLLCYQADKGKLTMDIIKHVLNGDFEVWVKIKDKFIEEDGYFYNKRLALEREKRIKFSESRRKNIKNRYICSTSVKHMENENENENIDINKKGIPPKIEEVKAYCLERKNSVDVNKWYNFYSAKGWMIGKNKMKDWKAAVRTWEEDKKEPKSPYKPFTRED